ncbi:hypothetical protein [Sphingomonas sp. KC8]|uniref:hypothetical protein n=1 Tax=Sphingomonas sp. KC8 TaxID=1030157 RepID=UPI00178C64EE|nr:hypothetical protein [Sphingomonas sp. KC8]
MGGYFSNHIRILVRKGFGVKSATIGACLPMSRGDHTKPAMPFGRFLALTIAAVLLVARVGPGCAPAMAMPVDQAAIMDEGMACHGGTPNETKPVAGAKICMMACAPATPDHLIAAANIAMDPVAPIMSAIQPLAGFVIQPSIPPPRPAGPVIREI